MSNDSGGRNALAVAIDDLNGDSRPDIVVVNFCNCSRGGISVLLGNGDGTFQSAIAYGSGGYDAYSVAAADVNGHGKPDLLVANECQDTGCANTNGSVGVLLGHGDGTFQSALTFNSDSGSPMGCNARSVAVGRLQWRRQA